MKALIKKEGREGLWLADVPAPTIGDRDVLIRIRKAAICGTDVHIWKWDEWAAKTVPLGLTVGHEYVGVVEDFAVLAEAEMRQRHAEHLGGEAAVGAQALPDEAQRAQADPGRAEDAGGDLQLALRRHEVGDDGQHDRETDIALDHRAAVGGFPHPGDARIRAAAAPSVVGDLLPPFGCRTGTR